MVPGCALSIGIIPPHTPLLPPLDQFDQLRPRMGQGYKLASCRFARISFAASVRRRSSHVLPAVQARARQSSALSDVIHSKCIDPDLQRALSELHPAATVHMTPHALATIREANRMVFIAGRLPSSLVRREAALASTGQTASAFFSTWHGLI